MYPYPAIGPISDFKSFRDYSFSRSTPCGPSNMNNTQHLLPVLHGYRSPIVKNPLPRILPSNYQVYSVVSNHMRGYVAGSRNMCYPNSGPTRVVYTSVQPSYMADNGSPFICLLSGRTFYNSKMAPPINAFTQVNNPFSSGLSRARNGLLLKLSNQTNTLGVTFAELGKTNRYLLTKTLSIGNALAGLKNSKRKFFNWFKKIYKYLFSKTDPRRSKARRHIRRQPWDKALASRWLEYNYAILPLVLDINGLLEFGKADPPVTFSTKFRSFGSESGTISLSGRTSCYWVDYKVLVQQTTLIESPLTYAMNRLGLTPGQLVFGIAWELTKFSFVADWFLKLNDLLQGTKAMQGLTFVSGFETIKFEGYENVYSGSRPAGARTRGSVMTPTVIRERLEQNHVGDVSATPGSGMSNAFSGMHRRVISKPPSYSYSASLGVTSMRRLLSLTSLASVLRR